jgi:hypothetical protein
VAKERELRLRGTSLADRAASAAALERRCHANLPSCSNCAGNLASRCVF